MNASLKLNLTALHTALRVPGKKKFSGSPARYTEC